MYFPPKITTLINQFVYHEQCQIETYYFAPCLSLHSPAYLHNIWLFKENMSTNEWVVLPVGFLAQICLREFAAQMRKFARKMVCDSIVNVHICTQTGLR